MTFIDRPKVLVFGKDESFLVELMENHGNEFEIQRALSSGMVDFLTKEWEPKICVLQVDENIESLVCFLRTKFSYSRLGIIIVSLSNDDIETKEKNCFRSGADHFVIEERGVEPIVFRIRALVKKNKWELDDKKDVIGISSKNEKFVPMRYGPVEVFPNNFLIKVLGETISPTPTQFRLLLTFISHRDQLLTRAWLKTSVWGDSSISPRTIDAQISKLKKLIPYLEDRLVNVYGKGYILTESNQNVA